MFNRPLFAASLEAHLSRQKLILREAGRQCHVSASTLSRLLHGETPDIETFALLCDWMRVSPSAFFEDHVPPLQYIPDVSQLSLLINTVRCDDTLPQELKESAVGILKAIYGLAAIVQEDQQGSPEKRGSL